MKIELEFMIGTRCIWEVSGGSLEVKFEFGFRSSIGHCLGFNSALLFRGVGEGYRLQL